MSVEKKVQALINDHAVAIFSKTYCPYCAKAKSQISELDLPDGSVGIIELDTIDDGSAIQDYLQKQTGQRTVPSVWINKDFIGGSSDLAKIPAKQIKSKVQSA